MSLRPRSRSTLLAAMLRGEVTLPWRDIYDIGTAHVEAAAGYYNRNVRVDTPTGPVNVRIPIHGADIMDLRLWREEEILPAITAYIRHAPRRSTLVSSRGIRSTNSLTGRCSTPLPPRRPRPAARSGRCRGAAH